MAAVKAVQVESCKFLRYNCDHSVFQKEYTRSNRKAGTKILRCFPHCCPEHAPRCYCGCSIHILVTFADASVVNDSDFIVCARFEASSSEYQNDRGDDGDDDGAVPTRKLTHGEQVVLPPEILQPMPQDSLECLWIRAYREGEGKQRSVPENSILYVLNNYRFPKWFYGYESGATKSQREMKHYLRAYVLHLERPKDLPVNWSSSWLASVVARHGSPGFTLISYRRASDPKRVAKANNTEDLNQENDDSESDSDTESKREERETQKWMQLQSHASRYRQILNKDLHLEDRQDHSNAEGILLGLRYGDRHYDQVDRDDFAEEDQEDLFQYDDDDEPRMEFENRLPPDVNEKLFWRQPKYAKILEYARQLSILQYFIVHAPMDEFWNPIMGLEDPLRRSWIEPVYNQTRDTRTRELLVSFCLPPLFRHQQYRRDQETLFGHHPVLVLCADVAVEFVTSRTLRRLFQPTLPVDFGQVNSWKLETRQRFAALVDGVYSNLSAFLTERRMARAMTDLVDEIVTLVHQNQHFHWMQLPIRELLEMATPEKFAFEAFCAQAREAFLSRQRPPRPRVGVGALALPHGDRLVQWNRKWLLDSRSLRLHNANEHPKRGPQYQFRARLAVDEFQFTAWELLSTIQQVGAIDMELDDLGGLRIQSVFGSNSGLHLHSQSMELILDGKYRVFRTFPNGVSTMAAARDGWVFGDYFGHLESPELVKIWLFAHKANARNGQRSGDGESPARCISVQLKLCDATGRHCVDSRGFGGDDQLLHVVVKMNDAMCPSVGDEGERRGGGDLAYLPSGIRHSIWNSLHWKPSTEFEVAYQPIEVSE